MRAQRWSLVQKARKREQASRFKGLITPFLAVMLLACGEDIKNLNDERELPPPGAAQTQGIQNQSEFPCQNQDPELDGNVKPANDWMSDGSGYFSVCRSRNDPQKLLIQGKPVHSSYQLCVYPAQLGKNAGFQQANLFQVTDRPGPYRECGSLKEGELILDINQQQYNFVYITEKPFAPQLERCLGQRPDQGITTPNKSFCPNYRANYEGFYSKGYVDSVINGDKPGSRPNQGQSPNTPNGNNPGSPEEPNDGSGDVHDL